MKPARTDDTLPSRRDKLDRALLALLQADARESAANLARKLGVARTTVVARLDRLERDGVVLGYTVRLREDAADRGLQAIVGITVRSPLRPRSRAPALTHAGVASAQHGQR